MTAQSSVQTSTPLVVRPLALTELVAAAVQRVLLPYSDQVTFVVDPVPCDVGLVDPKLLTDGWRKPLGLPLVAVTRDAIARSARVAEELGVSAVVGLDLSADRLVDVLLTVAHREDAAVTKRVLELSPRETEVLTMICAGASNAEIAAALFLSPNSVKTYIRTAYRKMGVTTRPQAVLWGVHRGL
jgi:DNA-binding CsgD family transcriptional regulator